MNSLGSEKEISWNGYSIFRVDESHYESLVEISKSAFGIPNTKRYYQLKNNTTGFGIPDLGFIAYSQTGEPAAFYGVFACQAELDGKIYSIAQSGDTMTHKNHTGKGLFTKLAELTYELCELKGIEFVYGFPNYNSYPGFSKKLMWEFPGKLNDYRIKIWTIPFAKISKKIPLLKVPYQLYKKLIDGFYNTGLSKINSSAIFNEFGGIHRSLEFIRYKQSISDSYILSFGKAKAWLKIDGFLYVGDIELNGESFMEVIRKIRRYAFMIGADVMVFQSTADTPMDIYFAKLVESREGLPWGFRRLKTEIDPSRIHYVTADFDTF
jgi:hypothetical protein